MVAGSQPGARDPVGVYISALAAPQWRTRWQAAQALGELADSRAVEPLIETLDDSNQWVRIVAAEALGQIGDENATPALLPALNDESIWVRHASVVALGQIGDTQAIRPLTERILGPPDNEWPEELRDATARALGAIGGPAIQVLIDALGDPDAWVSSAAARALGRIGDPQAITPLTELIKQEHRWVRATATQALAQIADARAVRAALTTDEAPRAFWKLMALREIDEATVGQLTGFLEDADPQVRAKAADVLSQLGQEPANGPFAATLRAGFHTTRTATPVRSGAATADGPGNLSPLLEALKDAAVEVRLAAAEALGKAGDASTIPALTQALQDDDSRVRAAVARSMGEISSRIPR
jgi:HEAT repeat protein